MSFLARDRDSVRRRSPEAPRAPGGQNRRCDLRSSRRGAQSSHEGECQIDPPDSFLSGRGTCRGPRSTTACRPPCRPECRMARFCQVDLREGRQGHQGPHWLILVDSSPRRGGIRRQRSARLTASCRGHRPLRPSVRGPTHSFWYQALPVPVSHRPGRRTWSESGEQATGRVADRITSVVRAARASGRTAGPRVCRYGRYDERVWTCERTISRS